MHMSTGAPEVKDVEFPQAEVTGSCELLKRGPGSSTQLSRRATSFFTTKPSPQPLRIFLIEVSTCPASVSQYVL